MRTYAEVQCSVGSYGLCHPDEKQRNYTFSLPDDAPKVRCSGSVPLGSEWDIETEDPVEAARRLVCHKESCLYSSALEDFRHLLAYLREHRLEHRVLRLKAKQDRWVKSLQVLEAEIEDAQRDLDMEVAEAREEQEV